MVELSNTIPAQTSDDSRLAKHEYWEQNFELELKNFESYGDDGEVWFGLDVQKKTIAYLLKKYPNILESDTVQPQILDVGTGNGAFLFKLAKKGFKKLKGIDYSENSIKLAQKIKESLNDEEGTFSEIELEFQNAFDLLEENRFDVIHDKGTFDVVFMNKELDNKAYAKAINHRLNKNNKDSSIFIITSCNCTSTELDEIFAADDLFTKVEEIKGYKTFTFGGV